MTALAARAVPTAPVLPMPAANQAAEFAARAAPVAAVLPIADQHEARDLHRHHPSKSKGKPKVTPTTKVAARAETPVVPFGMSQPEAPYPKGHRPPFKYSSWLYTTSPSTALDVSTVITYVPTATSPTTVYVVQNVATTAVSDAPVITVTVWDTNAVTTKPTTKAPSLLTFVTTYTDMVKRGNDGSAAPSADAGAAVADAEATGADAPAAEHEIPAFRD
ncbi:hypothetical protein K461DRAFT_271380 [Myriangium duriaei CBS 260.36]|uniref:Uncharacterized protein n=1 Tax=Myriangium duriaei CBS 260.36 TaxID=1168546 RepID=A0A9P4IU41_9PEZI|nr:hypothetical protein K461DRAFT_271380 [Myriangium duriaei CBS 260.36]